MIKKSHEKSQRSLIKAVTYRIISIIADFIAAFFFTKDTAMSIGFVLIINGYSIILYYLHERAWARIHWGKHRNSK